MEMIEQAERPDRKLYHITNAGRQELIGWLAEPVARIKNGEISGKKLKKVK
jgi:DNA-binding PadR family transcriptional regulator